MTRKEERREAVKTITSNQECNGLACWQCKEYCVIQAIEWADKTMLDKACEWLKDTLLDDNCGIPIFDSGVNKFIEDFRKAMEE